MGRTIRPIGTLSQKIQCQSRPSAMAPPTSGPIAMARPAMPPHAPSATARRSGGIAADRIVSVSGVTIAPPTPWIARARMRLSVDVDSAARAEPPIKIPIPIRKTRLRPNRSPRAAPVISRTANVRVYALTIHWSSWSDAPRSVLMTGRAVVTTRLSRATMNSASEVTTNVQSAFERVRVTEDSLPSCDLVVTKYVGEKRGAADDGQEAPPASGAIGWRLRNPLSDHDSGEPSISRAAAT